MDEGEGADSIPTGALNFFPNRDMIEGWILTGLRSLRERAMESFWFRCRR